MALRKVKGNFERMFDKNLTDLVRGIRNNKENEVIFENSASCFPVNLLSESNLVSCLNTRSFHGYYFKHYFYLREIL